jgi:hypothetical protein
LFTVEIDGQFSCSFFISLSACITSVIMNLKVFLPFIFMDYFEECLVEFSSKSGCSLGFSLLKDIFITVQFHCCLLLCLGCFNVLVQFW